MFALQRPWVVSAVLGLAGTGLLGQTQVARPAGEPVAAVARAASFPSAPGDSALLAALHREADLLKRGIARRQPAEADTSFLKRLFPASFAADNSVRYAWRPSAFGKQLFFSCRERDAFGQDEEGTHLFVLDPFQPDTYAVQVLRLEPIGDITNLAAFFFANIDRDGPKELLALVYAEVQHIDVHVDGAQLASRISQWQTQVFRYTGLDRTGRPHYQRDGKPRPYLNHWRTAAAVRRALASHAQAAH